MLTPQEANFVIDQIRTKHTGTMSYVVAGALAGLAVWLFALVLPVVNMLMAALFGRSVSMLNITSKLPAGALLIGIIATGVAGIIMALAGQWSYRHRRYWDIKRQRSLGRYGLDGIIGILVFTPLIWLFISYYGGFNFVWILAQRSNILTLLYGFIFFLIWEYAFNHLIRKIVRLTPAQKMQAVCNVVLRHPVYHSTYPEIVACHPYSDHELQIVIKPFSTDRVDYLTFALPSHPLLQWASVSAVRVVGQESVS